MRSLVPFVSEQKTVRGDGPEAQQKRAQGRVIDEVVEGENAPSSWEDAVPESARERSKPGAGVVLPSLTPASKGKQPSLTAKAQDVKAYKQPKASRNHSAPAFADGPILEWKLINQGRGIRVDVLGNIDHTLKPEWQRLLAEVEASDLREFEFNLSDTPALSLTGLGMLLLLRERRGLKDVISLLNCNPRVTELLQWCGMEKYFKVVAKPR